MVGSSAYEWHNCIVQVLLSGEPRLVGTHGGSSLCHPVQGIVILGVGGLRSFPFPFEKILFM